MIIDRYLRRQVFRPVVPILLLLVAVFASFSGAEFLGDAAGGLLAPETIAAMIGLKAVISLEVLIPVALFLSVVMTLSRLAGDSELVAAHALRVTPRRVQRAVTAVSLGLAVVVGVLSLEARPWAYRRLHALSTQAESRLDASAMRPGVFYVGRNGDRVIFFSRRDAHGGPARDVFVQTWRGDRMEIIHAAGATDLSQLTADGTTKIDLHDAHMYRIDPRGTNDEVLQAGDTIVAPDHADGSAASYSAVAARSGHLLASDEAPDVAELQWRLSTPVSTLLLGLIAIPLSRMGARNRSWRLGTAILLYFGYYILFTSARTWVQHGAIATVPGIWWVPGLLGLLLVASSIGPGRNFVGHARA